MAGEREREMYRLRVEEGLTLREIAARYGVGPERVRQLLNRHARRMAGRRVDARAMSRMASAARRARDLAQAQAHAGQLLAAWRQGRTTGEIARASGLRCRSVAQVIRATASGADRLARRRAKRADGAAPDSPMARGRLAPAAGQREGEGRAV